MLSDVCVLLVEIFDQSGRWDEDWTLSGQVPSLPTPVNRLTAGHLPSLPGENGRLETQQELCIKPENDPFHPWLPPCGCRQHFFKVGPVDSVGSQGSPAFGRPKHEIVLTIYKALISPTTCPPIQHWQSIHVQLTWEPSQKSIHKFLLKETSLAHGRPGVTVILGETDHVGQILRTQLSTMGWLRAGKSEVCLKPRLLCPCLSPLFVWPEHWPQSILGGNVVFKSRCAKHKVGTMNEAQHQAPDSEQASLKRFVFQRRGQTSWLFFH